MSSRSSWGCSEVLSQNNVFVNTLQIVLLFNFRKQILMTGMEISMPEEIPTFLRSHRPQTGPPRFSRKPYPDYLPGRMGEAKSTALPSTRTGFAVVLVVHALRLDFVHLGPMGGEGCNVGSSEVLH